jgi:hypothetical protein
MPTASSTERALAAAHDLTQALQVTYFSKTGNAGLRRHNKKKQDKPNQLLPPVAPIVPPAAAPVATPATQPIVQHEHQEQLLQTLQPMKPTTLPQPSVIC